MTRKRSTRLVHGRSGGRLSKTVNPPIERASTLMMQDIDALYSASPSYGRMGLAVHRELEDGLCMLENAAAARLAPSGLAACALAIASTVKAGDHILVSDNVYGPTRRFCTRRLRTMGVTATFFPATDASALRTLVQDTTVAIYLESPGSLTFDICDTPAIVDFARTRNITTIMDNTWGCGVLHRPLDIGVDLSVQALTKYVVGHADAFGGAVMSQTSREDQRVKQTAEDWGISLGPDDAYLCLRGLRTLSQRMQAHQSGGRSVAAWMANHPAVSHIFHPGFADHPQHALWQRDFTGSNGLFGAVLAPMTDAARQAFYDALDLFGFGFSWGGFESLLIPADPGLKRDPSHWVNHLDGELIRLHVGLEDPEDLIEDLDNAFKAAAKA
ncbi:MAG: cystathionine beta-lyase [Pseudomonadota bacterium]